ncbi:MAG: fatty acid desaturase, partial [Myxococcota bacterium]|nr:fatty acid desaturase [Myxococcota bacterium]
MSRPPWLKQALAAGNEFHFVQQTPWKHNLLNLLCLTGIAAAFTGVMALGALIPWWTYIPLATVLMGCLVFSLFVLVIHECSHCMFVLLKDREASRRLNHRIGTVMGELLFTNYMEHWAREHTVHHLRPMEDVDRQDGLRFSGTTWLKKVAQMLVPGAALGINPSRQYGFSIQRFVTGLCFFGGLATLGFVWIGWPVAVAIVMSFNMTGVCNMHKIAQEHGSGLAEIRDPYLRSRTYFYPGRWLFSPFCINYHFEHHANFNVPW